MSLNASRIRTYNRAIRDTATHNIPSQGNDGEPSFRIPILAAPLMRIENGLDQAVTVTLRGALSDDPTMAKDAPDVQNVVVAAGSRTIVDSYTKWSFVRVQAVCSVAPTTGNLVITFESIRE